MIVSHVCIMSRIRVICQRIIQLTNVLYARFCASSMFLPVK